MAKANIKDLLSKPKIIICEQGEIPIYKLTVGKKLELVELINEGKNQKAAFEIVLYTLKRAFPEASEEDLDNISDDVLEIITKEAFEFNGLSVDKAPQ